MITADRAWEFVRHKFKGRKLDDFRPTIFTLILNIPAGIGSTSGITPVQMPARAILYGIAGAATAASTSSDITRVSATWPNGEPLASPEGLGTAFWGSRSEVDFPSHPIIVSAQGTLNWVGKNADVENLPTPPAFPFHIAHFCLVPLFEG